MMPDNLEDPRLAQIEALRNAIQSLEALPLPQESKPLLDDLNRQIELLSQQLASESGQSRLGALYQVSQVLGTSLDLDQVLNQVMDAVIQLTHAERGFLILLDESQAELTPRTARSIDRTNLPGSSMEVSHTVIQNVLEQGAGVLTTDAQQDPRFAGKESIVFFALRSVMCTPLLARGKIIGVIYVDNRAQIGIFTNADLDLLNAFATQAAIAIENARLYTRTDQALAARVAELETLSRIDQQLNERLDFDLAAMITWRWALEGTGASKAWLVRYDEDNNLVVISGPQNEIGELLRQSLIRAVEEGTVIASPPTRDNPAYLVAPVHSSGRLLFIIAIERAEPFTNQSKQFLSRLAGHAGAALENAYLYKAVQDANTAKTKFVSVVTHELRIPMTSIRGYADLLRQGVGGSLSEVQLNFLDVIRNNVDRMSALVSDLSDISHIETGRITLTLRYLSVVDTVQDTLMVFEPRILKKNQELVVDISPDLPQVYADSNRLGQVLTNLINNAHKYTPENGRLMVSAHLDGKYVRIVVRDNGIGISLEDQKNLFGAFFRSENPEVREQQGWGLGLNLANRLVYLMGGEMGVTSVLGEGSTFWFTIPTAPGLSVPSSY
jgi:signal transduction histidine kinase